LKWVFTFLHFNLDFICVYIIMNRSEIKKLAIKKLNSKPVKNYKKQLCQIFIDERQKKDCITNFDKSFIKSFIHSYQTRM
jgi:hypothetical protein